MWLIFVVTWGIHTAYKVLQAMDYTRGAHTVVYPVVRGSVSLLTIIGAFLFFGEVFSWGQLAGVAALLSGIFGLALYNLQNLKLERETLSAAQGFAPATDVFVAFYNTYDAYGIRASTDPFTFLASLFLINSWSMPILGLFMRAIVIFCSVARDCHGAGLWVALWPLPLLALY